MATPAPSSHPPGAARDHRFHPLRIDRVITETDDARSFVLDVPADLGAAFAYDAGQFCTFRASVGGSSLFRCYSMSSSPEVDAELQVTVKRVPGGAVSNWMIDTLRPGDVIEVAPPGGVFRLAPGDGDIVAFGAGSGITPIFSIMKTALATTARRVRLLYANRDRSSVIFGAAVDALAVQHPDRLAVAHHFDVDDGFVGPDAVRSFLFDAGDAGDADVYICGPGPFMDIVERTLLDAGIELDRIHIERFTPGESLPAPEPAAAEPTTSRVTIQLDGRTDATDHRPGTTILQTARQLGLSPPYSCEAGSCATCMAMLVEGSATMLVNNALTDDEVADGWVLTCQATPSSPSVHVVYGYEET